MASVALVASDILHNTRLEWLPNRCVLQQQLIELLPMLQEVNAIAQEMDKCRTFDIVLLPALLQQTVYGQHKTARITIRMKCSKTGHTWMWDRGKFLNRRFLIQVRLYLKH
ncbi:Kinesin-like protein KIF28P [Taenia solium]|eukprot:TsM_000976800 transcript=TsM_000976800 gene=TsM_000976800